MRKSKKRAFTGFGVTLLFVLLFTVFFYANFKTVVVSGHSMDPTLANGQRLLSSHAYSLVGPIRDKDIVIVRDPDTGVGYIIKRVYKMGGEKVDYYNVPISWPVTNGEYTVPPGEIYLLGDNREVSEDSRKFGPVAIDQIIGKIVIQP